MPKIRDLGINVIPETMRPPEIGAGGGGGGGCGGTHDACALGTWGTCTPGTFGCTHVTFAPCTPATFNCTGTWGMPCGRSLATCTPGTLLHPTGVGEYAIGCPAGTFHCTPGTFVHPWGQAEDQGGCTPGTRVTTPYLTYQAIAQTAQSAGDGLTREAIEILKNQLHQQIAQLDELAKNIGPSTVEEIDAREQQLKAELEELAKCRNRLTSDK